MWNEIDDLIQGTVSKDNMDVGERADDFIEPDLERITGRFKLCISLGRLRFLICPEREMLWNNEGI